MSKIKKRQHTTLTAPTREREVVVGGKEPRRNVYEVHACLKTHKHNRLLKKGGGGYILGTRK